MFLLDFANISLSLFIFVRYFSIKLTKEQTNTTNNYMEILTKSDTILIKNNMVFPQYKNIWALYNSRYMNIVYLGSNRSFNHTLEQTDTILGS